MHRRQVQEILNSRFLYQPSPLILSRQNVAEKSCLQLRQRPNQSHYPLRQVPRQRPQNIEKFKILNKINQKHHDERKGALQLQSAALLPGTGVEGRKLPWLVQLR